MPTLDTAALRRDLDILRPEIAALLLEPAHAYEVGRRLSQLASQVTTACELSFLFLTEQPAA